MENIRFIKSNQVYKGATDFLNKHILIIKFNEILPNESEIENGFEILNENNNVVQAVYKDFTTIYRIYTNENKIEFSDDGSIYVEPVDPKPTPEELEIQFYQNKQDKINLSKLMLADHLQNNPLHSSVHGGVEGVYSVTSEKQSLMMSQYVMYQIEKSINPNAKLTWNESGKSCEEWTEKEFLQLVLEVKTYVSPLVSYQQKVEEQITNCTNQEDLDEIIIDYTSVKLKK